LGRGADRWGPRGGGGGGFSQPRARWARRGEPTGAAGLAGQRGAHGGKEEGGGEAGWPVGPGAMGGGGWAKKEKREGEERKKVFFFVPKIFFSLDECFHQFNQPK
jgi:hypothetical protein